MTRKHEEDDLHMAIVQFLRYKGFKKFFHTPNGGKRNPREGARFKRMGVKPGILDLIIYKHTKFNDPGLIMEVKVGNNQLTENQKQVIKEFEEEGWPCVVVRSLDESMKAIAKYY